MTMTTIIRASVKRNNSTNSKKWKQPIGLFKSIDLHIHYVFFFLCFVCGSNNRKCLQCHQASYRYFSFAIAAAEYRFRFQFHCSCIYSNFFNATPSPMVQLIRCYWSLYACAHSLSQYILCPKVKVLRFICFFFCRNCFSLAFFVRCLCNCCLPIPKRPYKSIPIVFRHFSCQFACSL